jgi:hypothetical protein
VNKSSKMVSLFLSTALILGTAGCGSAKKTVYDEEGNPIVQQNNSSSGVLGGYFAGRSSGSSAGVVPGVSAGGQSGSASSSAGTGITSGSHGGIGGGGSSAS